MRMFTVSVTEDTSTMYVGEKGTKGILDKVFKLQPLPLAGCLQDLESLPGS